MLKTHLALLAAGALLAGCHREAEVLPDLSGTYTASPTVRAAHPVALYTRNGPVSDLALTGRFLARRAWLASYFSATDQNPATGVSTQLAFRAGGRATLLATGNGRRDSFPTWVAARPAGSLLLQATDTTRYFTSPPAASCSRLSSVNDNVRTFSPPTRCVATSPATGYAQLCRTNAIWLVGVRQGQLFIPYLTWYVQTGGCSLARGGEWNTFNTAAISQLAAGDTLLVQEREIDFHK